MQARDVMTVPVHTVGPDCPVEKIARMLLEKQISAVPVVDGEDHVLGIVSEGDLFRRADLGTERKRSWWLLQFLDQERVAADFVKARGRHAEDVMTRQVVTVVEDTPVTKIAELLEVNSIKRVPVLRDGRVVGIVSRSSLLRALAAWRSEALPMVASDREIRTKLLETLRGQPWFSKSRIDICVDHGTVELWGIAMSKAEHEAVRAAVTSQPGVAGLVDRITEFPRFPWSGA
ncbi:MAG: CBS domain-containing protein [Proteobacteria bacterium]|nr:CBS domain-containing protein [Pseudomonadota bacterium]